MFEVAHENVQQFISDMYIPGYYPVTVIMPGEIVKPLSYLSEF